MGMWDLEQEQGKVLASLPCMVDLCVKLECIIVNGMDTELPDISNEYTLMALQISFLCYNINYGCSYQNVL